MADPRMPDDAGEWMRTLGWPAHHEQWHVESRWDYWRARAAQGDVRAQEIVDYAAEQGWSRAAIQEGATGHGLEFLAMHRAMLQLVGETFPQHASLLEGWPTPPRDSNAPDEEVPGGVAFLPAMAEATALRPTPADPLTRSSDPRTGIHNWLHNRWTDPASDVNLGDPTKNLFNARFWRLHGWIDRQWSRFRSAKGLSDEDPGYLALLEGYRAMMSHPHGHGHGFVLKRTGKRPAALERFFEEAG